MGTPVNLVADPLDPQVMYVVTVYGFGGRVYRSADGGKSWQRIGEALGEEPRALAIDPRSTRTLYAITTKSGVFKSTNGGDSWKRVAPTVRGAGTTWDGTQGAVVAVDPGNPRTVYAGGSGLYWSTDAGASWSPIRRGRILGLAIAPRNTRTLYAIHEITEHSGLLIRSVDGGRNWKTVSNGVGLSETDKAEGVDIDFERVAVTPSSGGLYMTGFDVLKVRGAVFKSTNSGTTWKRVARMSAKHGDPPTPLSFSALAVDPSGRAIRGNERGRGVPLRHLQDGRLAATGACCRARRLCFYEQGTRAPVGAELRSQPVEPARPRRRHRECGAVPKRRRRSHLVSARSAARPLGRARGRRLTRTPFEAVRRRIDTGQTRRRRDLPGSACTQRRRAGRPGLRSAADCHRTA